jgi:HK97 family phage major capsid protein
MLTESERRMKKSQAEVIMLTASTAARDMTADERKRFDGLLDELRLDELQRPQDVAETRGVPSGNGVKPQIEGRANEVIKPGQFRQWYNKAVENNVSMTVGSQRTGYQNMPLRSQGSDRDVNRAFGEVLGFAPKTIESRALLEDTSGSSQAITPQSWQSDFVDVLLPQTIIGKVGANVVPMSTEYVNIPVYTSTVSPTWLAEASSISLDANPAFAPLQLIAQGGFKDTTLVSIEAAQDAYITGGLPDMLAAAVAKKMAVVLDTSMLLGVSGNSGIPGLNSETGFVFRKQTGDAGTTGLAPTTSSEIGVVAEASIKKNVAANELAYVSNIGTEEAFRRIVVSAYGKYFDDPPVVVKNNIPWVTSENSALPYVETDPATASSVAQSGGSYSSVYCGPWSRFMYVGIHLDLQTQWLRERYIDSGEVGLFSFCRYSIRFAHPETFTRTIGVITV